MMIMMMMIIFIDGKRMGWEGMLVMNNDREIYTI
jgi:hypothetical protein